MSDDVVVLQRREAVPKGFGKVATRLVVQTAGSVSCYDVLEDHVEKVVTLPAQTRSACSFSGHLLYVDDRSGLQAVPLVNQGSASTFRHTVLEPLALVSSNSTHIFAVTTNRRLLCIDTVGNTIATTELNYPVVSISAGADGTLWIAGGEQVLGGYQVYWSTDYETFQQIPWPASAVSLHGDHTGIVWTVNSNSQVWKLHRLGEGNMPGCRQDPTCRNCMFKGYVGAREVANAASGFFVLHQDAILRAYPLVGSRDPMFEIKDVTGFSVN